MSDDKYNLELLIEPIDEALLDIIAAHTAGSPMHDGKKWTYLTRKEIKIQLWKRSFYVGNRIVKQLLKKHGFGYRKAQKTKTFKEAKNRDQQFLNITNLRNEYIMSNNPIISIDCKKKELLGNFYREGKLLSQAPLQTLDHDFQSYAIGKMVPFGIFDLKQNTGFVYLSDNNETAEFVKDCVIAWWNSEGKSLYLFAKSILILCDGGGANSSNSHLFKKAVQELSDAIGIEIRIAHFPPYTSKYNPIEHRLFPHISRKLQGVVLDSLELAKLLIERTTTSKGLKVSVEIIKKAYQKGVKLSQETINNLKTIFDDVLPKWNYRCIPAKVGN